MNSIPVVTKNILIINVLCFFGSVVAAKYGIDLNDLLGLHFFLASDFNPAQLITSVSYTHLSYPASCNSKAATELSVPPLIPSRTLLFGFIGANIRNQNEFFYILHSVILVQYYFSTSVVKLNHRRG